MIRKLVPIVVLLVVATVLVSLSSCGRDQQLVGITIQPASETFGAANVPIPADAGLQVQLRALGSYIHPPVTKDLTDKAVWSSNTPQMMTVDSTGLLTVTGQTCGATLVSATVTTNSSAGGLTSSGAIVTGFMTGNVVCFTSSGGGGPLLSLGFQGLGSGTVSSSPAGLSCSAACATQAFPVGTQVTLTATPTGTSTFGSWQGCDTPGTTNPCSVNLTAPRTVIVSFN
jgi:hypothetical protein